MKKLTKKDRRLLQQIYERRSSFDRDKQAKIKRPDKKPLKNNIPLYNNISVTRPLSKKYKFLGCNIELNLSDEQIFDIKRYEKMYGIKWKYKPEDFKQKERRKNTRK